MKIRQWTVDALEDIGLTSRDLLGNSENHDVDVESSEEGEQE